MKTPPDMIEVVAAADKALSLFTSTGKITEESVEAFGKATEESVEAFGKATEKMACSFLFLDCWLCAHRALIRHAYGLEKSLYYTSYNGLVLRGPIMPFRMSDDLRTSCAIYLKIRKAVMG